MTVRWRILLLAAALACLCVCSSGGGGGTFGLTRRDLVTGLTFPTGLPQPRPMTTLGAFPNLGFNLPVFLTYPPDGTNRIAVVQQDGFIQMFANSLQVATMRTFLDINSRIRGGGEQGLLGLAFHPSYASNGFFYVYYTASNPHRCVISRWRVSAGDPDVADPTSEQVLLQFDHPYDNHNGGSLAFGPDGMLYIASGDGGSGNDPQNYAQSLTTLLGKILRIAPDGSIPADNPFVGGTNGERGEIWAYGMRNPWRMSFDRATGALWVGDVGQSSREEIDIIRRGGNYGWRVYEGTRSNLNPNGLPPTAFDAPIYDYTHAVGASITGGYVYRGATLTSLIGAYVYADFTVSRIWALVHDGQQMISNNEIAGLSNPSSFGEDEAGELYICSFDGHIHRLVQSGGGGGNPFPRTLSGTGLFTDLARLTPTAGMIEYDVNSPLWSDGARKRRWLALPGSASIGFHATEAFTFPIGTVLVKHFELDVAPNQTRRLETRVLLRHDTGWQGYTYRWNAQGTDADLLDSAASEVITVQTPSGPVQQTWAWPSRTECAQCHTTAAGHVLGVRARQLHRSFDYAGVSDNQLRAWNHIGLFTTDIGAESQYEALPDPAGTAAASTRVRAYLDTNCAMCHRPGGTTPVNLDLRYGIAAAQMNAIGVLASVPVGGDPTRLRIAAGSKEQSDLWERMRRRDLWAMPPLASHVVDQTMVDLIGAWIDAGAGN